MKTRYSTIIALLFLLVSCDDLLEEQVYSEFSANNYLKTVEELQAQALGLYDLNSIWSIEVALFDLVFMPSEIANSKKDNKGVMSAYLVNSASAELKEIWRECYKLINNANVMIKYAPDADVSEETWRQFVGEARFIRAYYYFWLVRLWGEVPIFYEPVEEAKEELITPHKQAISKVYDLIIEDLTYAKDNMPKTTWGKQSPPGRSLAAAAYNLLGLVQLTKAGYPLLDESGYDGAIEVIEEMMDKKEELGIDLLDNWADNFDKDNIDNPEMLYALGSFPVNYEGSGMPRVHAPPASTGYAYATAYFYGVSYDFYKSFEDNDVRKKDGFVYSFLNKNGGEVSYDTTQSNEAKLYMGRNGVAMHKYIDGTASSPITHTNRMFFMRFVESYLILAEAYCENNDLVKAKENLSVVRDRVGASVITSNDQDELRQIIREERWRELYGEFTELFDMRRWGPEIVKEQYDNHVLIDRWYSSTAGWRDAFLLYPIPSSEMDANPNMIQNEGW